MSDRRKEAAEDRPIRWARFVREEEHDVVVFAIEKALGCVDHPSRRIWALELEEERA